MELIENNHVATTPLSLSCTQGCKKTVVKSPEVLGAFVMVQTTFSGWSVTCGGKLAWLWEWDQAWAAEEGTL